MNGMQFFYSYLAALVPLLVIDGVWLGVVAKSFYASQLKGLMTDQVEWWAAGLFYVLYAAGIVFFAVQPAETLGRAFLYGAFLGLIAYVTYDLTNQAVLKNWPVIITVTDIAWGAVLTGLVSVIALWIMQLLGRA